MQYVSTIGAHPPEDVDDNGMLTGAVVPSHPEQLYNGYTQSKWVAEALVRTAFARGFDGCVYRVGSVVGHSQTGAHQGHELRIPRRACIATGVAPESDDLIPAVPVDHVACAILGIAASAPDQPRVCYIDDDAAPTLSHFFAAVRSFGYRLEPLDVESWREAVLAASARYPGKVLPDIAFALSKPNELHRVRRTRQLRVDTALASSVLAKRGIQHSTMREAQIHRCLGYFVSTGFLPAP